MSIGFLNQARQMQAAKNAGAQANLGMPTTGPNGMPLPPMNVPKGYQFSSQGQQNTTGFDPNSQAYIDQMRQQAQGGADVALNGGPYFTGPQTMSVADQTSQFMNPYQDQVMAGLNSQYDKLRNQAMTQTSQQATQSGAYGGTRAAMLAGSRMGALDQAQMQQTGDMLYNGYNNALQTGLGYTEQQRQLQQQKMQEPLWRQQQAQGMLNLGMGPTGTFSNQTGSQYTPMAPQGSGQTAQNILGGAATGAGIGAKMGGMFGLPGNAVGALAGGAIGLLGKWLH